MGGGAARLYGRGRRDNIHRGDQGNAAAYFKGSEARASAIAEKIGEHILTAAEILPAQPELNPAADKWQEAVKNTLSPPQTYAIAAELCRRQKEPPLKAQAGEAAGAGREEAGG